MRVLQRLYFDIKRGRQKTIHNRKTRKRRETTKGKAAGIRTAKARTGVEEVGGIYTPRGGRISWNSVEGEGKKPTCVSGKRGGIESG
jgi:hypothetical protein